jgi:hypothetical protein
VEAFWRPLEKPAHVNRPLLVATQFIEAQELRIVQVHLNSVVSSHPHPSIRDFELARAARHPAVSAAPSSTLPRVGV